MFMGPLEVSKPWSQQGVEGARKFIGRVWNFITDEENITADNDGALTKVYHQTVKKVTSDFEELGFNTAISQMMIFINDCYKEENLYKDYMINFVQLLSPWAPHVCNEMYEILTGKQDLAYRPWPTVDETKLVQQTKEVVVQVNGKVRAKFNASADASDEELYAEALKQENVIKNINGQEIKKHFVIKNKMVNIVI